MEVRAYLKKNGVKLAWLAKKLRMSEGLLRYHLDRKVSDELEVAIKKVFATLATELVRISTRKQRDFEGMGKTDS